MDIKAETNADNNSVKAWRKSMGYSQKEAADALGMSIELFGVHEAAPNAPKYIKLAMRALSVGFIVDGKSPAMDADET